ncbi:MAG: hypothetical protein S4CHLAM81_02360 [Chlamydiales bacterium]|nr:hypothetical protein [Chlamydiales bacterium]
MVVTVHPALQEALPFREILNNSLTRSSDNVSIEASFSPRLTHKGLDVRLRTSPR